jgi:hypothetical protein
MQRILGGFCQHKKMVAGHPVLAQSDRSVAWQHADANEGMPK